jgi:hypothetical protein
MIFKFDPILYVEHPEYPQHFSNKIIYVIIEVVSANPNITINQVCSLLRNTLQIPEELTRTIINTLLNKTEKVFKAYEDQNEATHLTLLNQLPSIQVHLAEQYPELVQYAAPTYNRGKK